MPRHPMILVVDDEVAIRGLLVEVLRGQGFAVMAAPNGRLAIVRARRRRPDLILMDIMMPELDGWEAARHLQAMPDLAPVPIVLMSAAIQPPASMDSIAGFVPKPFDLDYLLTVVRRALVGWEERR